MRADPYLLRNAAVHGTRVGFVLMLLLVVAAMAPLQTDVYGVRIYTPYLPFSMALLLLLSLWVLRLDRVSLRREEIALMGVSLLGVAFSFASVDPQKALNGALMLVYASGVYMIVRYWMRLGILTRENLIGICVVAFVLLSLIALLQILLQKNIGVVSTYFGESSAGGTYADSGSRLRISGPLGNANVFSQVYAVYGTIVVAVLLFSRSGPMRVGYALMTTLLLVLIVVASLSRSGIIGIVILQGALYLYWIGRDRRAAPARFLVVAIPVLALMIVLAALYALYPHAAGSVGLSRLLDSGGGGRLALAEGAWLLISEPKVALFGVGSGQFFKGIAEYGVFLPYKEWREIDEITSSVHNWTLQVAVENGLVVLLLYVYALAGTVMRGWSVRRSRLGWVPAALGLIVAVLYMVPLQLTTAGLTPWVLTPVYILLAWIQHEYDEARRSASR